MSFSKIGAARIDASIRIVGGVPVRMEELLDVNMVEMNWQGHGWLAY